MRLNAYGRDSGFPVSGALTPYRSSASPRPSAVNSSTVASRVRASSRWWSDSLLGPLSSRAAVRAASSRWSARWQSPVTASATIRSVNRSTWPDAFSTTSGVTAGHSSSSMPSSSTKWDRHSWVTFCLTAQPGGP